MFSFKNKSMKSFVKYFGVLTLVSFLWLQSCKPDVALDSITPDTSGNVNIYVPKGWPQPAYTFQNNPLTQAGFELGRKIFYDSRLSRDNSVSCASCHQQFAAFSQFDHPLSHGINGLFGKRNTPGLSNIAWFPKLFWDGGVINLENQPINPIQNPVEMDDNLPDVISKLSADSKYPAMFKNAFGSDTINSQRIFKALALFMAPMISDNSKYDKYMRGETGGAFTTQELNGLNLFRQKCASCHQEPMFTDFSFRNNGLIPDAQLNDTGRAHITGDPNDIYKFRVPSLRNVALTKPYMHDGRFGTLDAVLEHYRSGIYQYPTLDTSLKNGITMTNQDKLDIISFLNTLTDTSFVHDKRFADPGN